MPPIFSVIIPVRDEAAGLAEAVAHVRRTANGTPIEVVVVDGRSADGTLDVARRSADRAEVSPKTGRAAQMDHGARLAAGDVLVFLHADTRLPDGWPALLRRECPSFFEDRSDGPAAAPSDPVRPRPTNRGHGWRRRQTGTTAGADGKPGPRLAPTVAAAASFRLSFDSPGPIYRMIALGARVRQALTGVPHGDQALVLPRRIYAAAGGFPETPLMEEYLFAARLKRFGRIAALREPVLTSGRRYRKNGPIRNALRNTALVALYYLKVPPRVLARWYVLAAALLAAVPVAAFDHTHALYAKLLAAHVKNGRVDYAALKDRPADLDAYLSALAAVRRAEFDAWPRDQRLAFLYNLYNAQTLKLILDHYPGIKSIKDIGHILKGPWDQPVVRLFGENVTLNHLEHKIIRPLYKEPRSHFALVCAAKGCPPLRPEPYEAKALEAQLEHQLRLFFEDQSKNRKDPATRTLHLSPIFDWFEEDFSEKAGSVAAYVAPYFMGADGYEIEYTDYDWSLNDAR